MPISSLTGRAQPWRRRYEWLGLAATRVRRAAEYLRVAFVVRRLPADLFTLQLSLELTSVTVVTLELIGRVVELRRLDRTRRVTGATQVVEVGVSVFSEDVEVLREIRLNETPAFRHFRSIREFDGACKRGRDRAFTDELGLAVSARRCREWNDETQNESRYYPE